MVNLHPFAGFGQSLHRQGSKSPSAQEQTETNNNNIANTFLMDTYGKIKQRLQELCQSGGTPSAFVLAKVKKVDGQTCSVLIGDLELADVRLRAVVNQEESGILITPKEGSFVMITDLSNGRMSDWAVAMYSEVDKVEFNSGKNDGLININDLTDKLNKLVDEVNNLKDKFNGHTHSCDLSVSTTGGPTAQSGYAQGNSSTPSDTASAATKFDKSDYEDDKITH